MTIAGETAQVQPEPAAAEPEPAGAEPAGAPRDGAVVTAGQVYRWAMAGALGVLTVLVAAVAVYVVRDILVLVLIAVFIAVSLDPAVRLLTRRGMRRSFAVAIIGLLVVVAFTGFAWSVVPPLVGQGGRLVNDLPGYLHQLEEKSQALRELGRQFKLTDRLAEFVRQLPERLAASTLSFVQQFFGAVFSGVTVLVLTIYFMADLPRLRRGLVRLFPASHRSPVANAVDVVVAKVGGYMIGNMIISVFAGVATFAALKLLGVPFAVPLAVTVAIADLIPMVGATLGAAICVLVSAFTAASWTATVGVAVFFVVYQQIENYLIAPRVLRNTVDLSAVAILITALIGGTVLGVVGALMAIPIAAAIKVVISRARADQG